MIGRFKVSRIFAFAGTLLAMSVTSLAQDEGGRERRKIITSEGQMRKSGDKTTIDFDSTDITGERRDPMSTMIKSNRVDKSYDFVKVRMSWHPEMINSTTSLDTKAE